MSYALLARKLNLDKEPYVDSVLLREYAKTLKLDYLMVIKYLLANKYLYRILRGFFYKPTIKERKMNRLDVNHLEAIAETLKRKGVKNWYYGLDSAMKLNNLTHEFFAMDFVVSDSIFRSKPITILGMKVRFIKLKKEIVKIGIVKGNYPVSDLEKTVLDMIYLMRYDGLSEKEIELKMNDLMSKCSKEKMFGYSSKYNKKMNEFIRRYYERPD